MNQLRELQYKEIPSLGHQSAASVTLEDYSVAKSHMGRNIGEMDIRLLEHQETQQTQNANTDEILGQLYREHVAIRK